MTKTLHIDFISDVVCPWCVVGLGGLEQALKTLKAEGIEAEVTFRPFELNPGMAPEGEDVAGHLARKYGTTPEQSAKNREMIRERAAEAMPDFADGRPFEMRMGEDSRIWNTFDAHRLLHWAGEVDRADGGADGAKGVKTGGRGRQAALKKALFAIHFTEGRNLTDAGVLTAAAEGVGLDRAEAAEVLASGRFVDEVRAEQALWRGRGINAVPAVVVEGKWLISGGQPAGVFEEALRGMAGEG